MKGFTTALKFVILIMCGFGLGMAFERQVVLSPSKIQPPKTANVLDAVIAQAKNNEELQNTAIQTWKGAALKWEQSSNQFEKVANACQSSINKRSLDVLTTAEVTIWRSTAELWKKNYETCHARSISQYSEGANSSNIVIGIDPIR